MKYLLPLVIIAMLVTSCANKAQTGAGTGMLLGATVGALASKDKLLGAGIGAGIGLALGYMVGNEWDKYDQQKLNNSLETSRSGQTTQWNNPDTGASYSATPQPAYQQGDTYYRDVQVTSSANGKQETTTITAYRNPDGTWTPVNQ